MPTYRLHIAYILSPKIRLHIKFAYISPTVFGSTARRMRVRVRVRVQSPKTGKNKTSQKTPQKRPILSGSGISPTNTKKRRKRPKKGVKTKAKTKRTPRRCVVLRIKPKNAPKPGKTAPAVYFPARVVFVRKKGKKRGRLYGLPPCLLLVVCRHLYEEENDNQKTKKHFFTRSPCGSYFLPVRSCVVVYFTKSIFTRKRRSSFFIVRICLVAFNRLVAT